MDASKKILTVVIMILATLGFVTCAAGVIAAWAINEPTTQLATGALTTVEQYGALGSQTARLVGQDISDIKNEISAVNQRLAGMTGEDQAQVVASVGQRLDEIITPKLQTAAQTAQTIGQTAVNINQTLESVNRIPGVNVPTFTDELQMVGARLQDVSTAVEGIRATASEVNFDGSRLQAATGEAAARLDVVETSLATAQTQMERLSAAAADTASRVPGWIDSASILLTLLLILFGVGQVFLFKAALDWFKRL